MDQSATNLPPRSFGLKQKPLRLKSQSARPGLNKSLLLDLQQLGDYALSSPAPRPLGHCVLSLLLTTLHDLGTPPFPRQRQCWATGSRVEHVGHSPTDNLIRTRTLRESMEIARDIHHQRRRVGILDHGRISSGNTCLSHQRGGWAEKRGNVASTWRPGPWDDRG